MIFFSQKVNIPIHYHSAWIRQQMKMMPMILIQTMCNELCLKTPFGDLLLAFRTVTKTCVAAEVGGMLHTRAAAKIHNYCCVK